MLIALCYGANFGAVRNANPEIGDPENLLPGTTVTIPNVGSAGNVYGPPCVASHTVQSGDTWDSIARAYNASLEVLQWMNPDGLSVGRVLIVPRNSGGGERVLLSQPPVRLIIPPGSTSVTKVGILADQSVVRYVFAANEGQAMLIKVISSADLAEMTIYREGAAESLTASSWGWTGRIDESGDHIIEITSAAVSPPIHYCLEVNFGTASSATCATPTP